MKMRQGFRWKKSTEQQWNKENFAENLVAVGAAVIFDVLCAIIFLNSAKYMLEMVYADLEYTPAFTVRAIWLLFLVAILLETTQYVRRLPAFFIRWALFLSGAYMTVRWVQKEDVWQKLCSGFWHMASVYLEAWNVYFESTWYCPEGMKEFDCFFVEAVLLTVLVLLFWLAKLGKKNYCIAWLPVILFAAGLLVGKEPSEKGILLLFAGILLAGSRDTSLPDFKPSEEKRGKYFGKLQHFVWIFSGMVILLLCSIVPLAGRKLAEKTVTEYAGVAEGRILDAANQISNWEIWRMVEDPGNIEKTIEGVLGTTDYNYEQLNNRSPQFEDIPYLRITLEEMPFDRIYLKGFYGDIYNNGIWEKNIETFRNMCTEHGQQADFVQEELAVLGVDKLKKRYNVKRLENHSNGLKATVFYYEPSTIKAYLPYFSEKEGTEISVEGEAGLKKLLSVDELSFTMWKYAGSFDTKLRSFAQGISKTWEPWYEQYVMEQYLSVPEDMEQVKQVAAELSKEDLSRTKLGEVETENEVRLAKAYLVADWMGRNTTYSRNLPNLPWMKDPIEYFLGTSRMGYCMHYASASVMILREMGVPARYASGYVVGTETFKKEKEGYVAEVLDNQAHAWAEVYLDSIGWVPVEVTAGYSALLPTPTPTPVPTNTPTPTPTNTPTPTPTNTPTPTPTPTSIPEKTEVPTLTPAGTVSPVPTKGIELGEATPVPGTVATPVPTNTPTPTPAPTPVPGSSELGNKVTEMEFGNADGENEEPEEEVPQDSSNKLGEERRNWEKTILKSLLVFIVVIGIGLVLLSPATIVDHFFRLEKISHRRIRKEMQRNGNGRAIKLLNRAIYRKLCFSGMVKKGCTDKEYEKALKENFSVLWPEEWDRYMEIVKAAEFSLRDFTEEEAEFCYKIYRDIIY